MDPLTTTLAILRKDAQSIFHRVHSIAEDAAFVKRVHDHYPDLPLVPNMRCGAWYTDPAIACPAHAYFKSTDGHTNNWSFNLRRPNLCILPRIIEHAGLVLVDSTRAGKRIPDALSKTVPIWCAVVNRAISLRRGVETTWDTALYTPPGSVSAQEHSQIELKLDAWAAHLATSSYHLPALDYPLRPIWITPATTVFPAFPRPPDCAFYPVICISASKQVVDGIERRSSGFVYIQGSGDDHELWGMGLTPAMYWRYHDKILSTGPADLPDLVRSLVADHDANPMQPLCATPIGHILGRISICSLVSLGLMNPPQTTQDVALLCLTPRDQSCPIDTLTVHLEQSKTLHIQTPDGKKGQHHFLTTVLPRSMPFIQHHLQNHRTVCIACNTGTDISVGVALVALALFFHSDGSLCAHANGRDAISKEVLKTRLQWIISSYPQANPSRTTLKRVNDFLLSPLSIPSRFSVPSHADHDGPDG